MYEHVKTGCKHIPPSEQPLQFQSEYYLNKSRIMRRHTKHTSKRDATITIRTYLAICFGRDRPSSGQLRTTIKVQ